MTTELRLDEVAVDAIVAKLQAGWAARATAINAEKADVNQIAKPDDSLFFVGRMQQIPAWPACFVLAGTTQFREQGAHSLTTAIEVNVWVCDTAQDGPSLARKLMRQARAVIEVLYDDAPQEQAYVKGSTTTLAPYRLFPTRTVPGAVFAPSGQESWRGSYLIVFRAEQEEM